MTSRRHAATLLTGLACLTVAACGTGSTDADTTGSPSTPVAPETPPTAETSRDDGDDDTVANPGTSTQESSSQGSTEDSHLADAPDALLQVELAEFVVSANTVSRKPDYEAPNRSGDVLTVRPFNVDVVDVLWVNDHHERNSSISPAARTAVRGIELAGQRAVTLAADALADEATAGGDLVVGLVTLSPTYTDVLDETFGVTFVATVEPDGSWSFPGLPPESQADEVMATLTSATGATSPIDALDRYHAVIAQANSSDAPSLELTRIYDEVSALFTEPRVQWVDRPVTNRMLTIEEIPDSFRSSVEAIGLEIVVSDPSSADLSRADEPIVSVRSSLGVVHQFYPSVGDHAVLVLRPVGESLDVVLVHSDGSADEIGEIPAFRAGDVGIIQLIGSGPDTAGLDGTRPPDEDERAYAAQVGVLEDGTLLTTADR